METPTIFLASPVSSSFSWDQAESERWRVIDDAQFVIVMLSGAWATRKNITSIDGEILDDDDDAGGNGSNLFFTEKKNRNM